MSLSEAALVSYYRSCEYWPRKHSKAPRPSELHTPLLVSDNADEIVLKWTLANNKAVYTLDEDDCRGFAPVLLHESLFHFYKSFYNYLAGRSLYHGGLLPWIKVTLYYSKFYMARSVTALCGRQAYRVSRDHVYFAEKLAKALATKGKEPNAYSIWLEMDLERIGGRLLFDREPISSHEVVWNDYRSLSVRDVGLHRLLYEEEGESSLTPLNYLMKERYEENYSFDGYMQLDFNLSSQVFKDYFERDYLKTQADTLYDQESGEVLLAFCSQYGLYERLGLADLPIEREKFEYMIDYCLQPSQAKDSLLALCREGFPIRSLRSADGTSFYDEFGRYL